MLDSLSFWSRRLRALGHTGWSDPTIYAYDQSARLMLIRSAVGRRPARGKALDFGCGTGDFSKLLLSLGFQVCGYDPFVRPKIKSRDFIYAGAYHEIPYRDHAADLAITVTSLDHVLKESDIREALAEIRGCLKDGASLFMIEYALDSVSDRSKYGMSNDYQAFRTVSEWKTLLTHASFRILDLALVAHPIISPSEAYLRFSRKPFVRLRRRLPRWLPMRSWWDRLLAWQAAGVLRTLPIFPSGGGMSPLKLIHSIAD